MFNKMIKNGLMTIVLAAVLAIGLCGCGNTQKVDNIFEEAIKIKDGEIYITLPIADKNLTQKQIDNTYADSAILSDVCSWRKYYVLKYECKDTKCTDDPLSKGRDCRFKMYIILEGEPAVLPALRFEKFIDECIKTGYEVLTAGVNEHLKIKIPDEFFNIED